MSDQYATIPFRRSASDLRIFANGKSRVNETVAKVWQAGVQDIRSALDEHAIVAITDSEGRIIFVNEKFCSISGYSKEELIGRDHRIVSSSYHPKEFFAEMWRYIQGGETWRGEFKNRAKDGSDYWVASTIVPVLDDDGKAQQFVAISADVTEQKRVEAELAHKLRLQRLLAALSSRFVALAPGKMDEAIEETQRLIVETLGLDRSTLWQITEDGTGFILTHCWQRPGLLPLPLGFETKDQVPWAQARVLRGETVLFESLKELPPEAASDVEAFEKCGPKSNVTIPLMIHGHVFGAIAFSTLTEERKWREDDISAVNLVAQIVANALGRERAERSEEQLRNELAHAMRVATLGELATALAHELNQPLAAILSNAQAARRFLASNEMEPKELQDILDDIVRADKRAGSVIHNLRGMVSKRPAEREECCLNELVNEVVELMHGEFVAQKIELRLNLSPVLPLVHVARVELQQVLVNLLVNAAHSMREVPSKSRLIELETSFALETVLLTMRDHGHGIALERLGNIFNPFFSTKRNGLGMGLSICRRIIENHQGTITASNHEEGGAVFQFTLPEVVSVSHC